MKHNKIMLIVFSVLIFPISTSARANILNMNHHIDRVTVYPRNAMVTRTAKINLTQGEHVLVLNNLPASMHDKSLRVAGRGSARVIIGSVERKFLPSDVLVQSKEKNLNTNIIILKDEIAMLNNDIESLNLQLTFIKSIGKNIPKTINEEIKVNTLNPKVWKQAWENIGSGASDTFKAILSKNQQHRLVLNKLAKLQTQLNQIQTGSRSVSQARININVQEAGDFTLDLSYQMSGATWQPVYDARLNVEQSNFQLIQYGQVRQRTGEDWSKVKLTLSTSNPTLGVKMPDLQPWFIRILNPIRARSSVMKNMDIASFANEASIAGVLDSPETIESKSEFDYAQQIVSDFAAEFIISGRSNILADNSPQKFTITENQLSATLSARVVPKKESKAYLYAETVYDGLAPLLPGLVSLFRDNTYIGNQTIAMVRPSEKIKLSFGVDDRIKVDYRMVSDKRSETGFLTTSNVVTRLFRAEITNHHTIPFNIELLEHIPVSQNQKIMVELSDKTTPSTTKNLDSRLGVMAWKYLYLPKAKRQITIGYNVTYPKDLIVQGL